MVALSDIQRRREQILRVAKAHGAGHVRVFGSLARGEGGEASDVDLLVEMDQDRSLMDRIALKQALEDLLGVEVDVVNEKAIRPAIREHVLRDLVEL
jgi:predicted nucleotidyltransferase